MVFGAIGTFFRRELTLDDDSFTFRRIVYPLYRSPLGKIFHYMHVIRRSENYPHRKEITNRWHGIVVTVVPFGRDNYSYLVRLPDSSECLVIDCGDADAVKEALGKHKLQPVAVISTHKHWDHCYGNKELRSKFPQSLFIGGDIDRPSGCTKLVAHSEELQITGMCLKFHLAPVHTVGHMLVQVWEHGKADVNSSLLFTGDVIFVAGAGKTFESNDEEFVRYSDEFRQNFGQMGNIWLFPGHEYARENLITSRLVDPDNVALFAAYNESTDRMASKEPMVPVLLRKELSYNPHFRTRELCKSDNMALRVKKLVELRNTKAIYCKNGEEIFDLLRTPKEWDPLASAGDAGTSCTTSSEVVGNVDEAERLSGSGSEPASANEPEIAPVLDTGEQVTAETPVPALENLSARMEDQPENCEQVVVVEQRLSVTYQSGESEQQGSSATGNSSESLDRTLSVPGATDGATSRSTSDTSATSSLKKEKGKKKSSKVHVEGALDPKQGSSSQHHASTETVVEYLQPEKEKDAEPLFVTRQKLPRQTSTGSMKAQRNVGASRPTEVGSVSGLPSQREQKASCDWATVPSGRKSKEEGKEDDGEVFGDFGEQRKEEEPEFHQLVVDQPEVRNASDEEDCK